MWWQPLQLAATVPCLGLMLSMLTELFRRESPEPRATIGPSSVQDLDRKSALDGAGAAEGSQRPLVADDAVSAGN